jgi:hypothetical protein
MISFFFSVIVYKDDTKRQDGIDDSKKKKKKKRRTKKTREDEGAMKGREGRTTPVVLLWAGGREILYNRKAEKRIRNE